MNHRSNRTKAIHTVSRSLHLLPSDRRCALLLHATAGLLSRHDQDLKSVDAALQIGILLHEELIPLFQVRNVFRRFGEDRRLGAQSAHAPPIRCHHGRHLAQRWA